MPRPVHFEIHATDPAAARPFYEGLFRWRFEQWGEMPYWLISTSPEGDDGSPGIDGAMVARHGRPAEDGQPVNAFVITVDVPDCAGYLDRALAAGGPVAVPLQAVPGVGWLADVKDPDGNILGRMPNDPSAGSVPTTG
jgi:predicted enzyme related to lactoylglutathione lyase